MTIYKLRIEDRLKRQLKKLYKKDRNLYEACMKKMEEVIKNPEHYKPLTNDLKGIRRVHLIKSFVLAFRIEENAVKFLDIDHHDKIYKKRFG